MKKLNFRDKWILVTGASSGLGEAIAVELASHEGAHLIITARRKDRLEALKQRIESETDREVVVIPSDLSDPRGSEKLFRESVAARDVYGIINNAGMTDFNPAGIQFLDRYEKILEVNFKSLMRLSLLFLEYFREKGEGAILNITSMGAFFPLVYQGVYSASKHAAQVFTEILSRENTHSQITISSFAPGGIATEMLSSSGLDQLRGSDDIFNWSAERVAKKAIRSFRKRKLLSVPGIIYNAGLILKRILPKRTLLYFLEKSYRKQ